MDNVVRIFFLRLLTEATRDLCETTECEMQFQAHGSVLQSFKHQRLHTEFRL